MSQFFLRGGKWGLLFGVGGMPMQTEWVSYFIHETLLLSLLLLSSQGG